MRKDIEDFDFDFGNFYKNEALTDLVAVYGTLRKGMGNHCLLSRAEFLGSQRTDPIWEMYASGCPVIVKGKSSILIEVYKVSKNNLNSLDRLEGYPDFYNRKIVKTNWGDAWIYFMEKLSLWPNMHKVEHGDYVKFRMGKMYDDED